MKILFIHNDYYKLSGEEVSANRLAKLLIDNGHEVKWYRRSSKELDDGSLLSTFRAAASGVYSKRSAADVAVIIDEYKPDVVQIQNIYPFISPSIFPIIKSRNIPIVMRCPNYRLFCPNGLFLDSSGAVCEKCTRGLREIWCVLKNCENNLLKSGAYALRNAAARFGKALTRDVDVFIVQSEFQKGKFVENGVEQRRIEILPGAAPDLGIPPVGGIGEDVCFIGRLSREKGVGELVDAARVLPNINFVVAGGFSEDVTFANIPKNVVWRGFLDENAIGDLVSSSRIVIVPSKCYEGFPNVIARAMAYKKPVICSRLGGLAEIVVDQVTGLHFEAGSASDLAEKIATLYKNPSLCVAMGIAGKQIADELYSPNMIYRKLLEIYEKAAFNNRNRLSH
jgi:glycosyltransferase involved in cell wall biosynthesis